MKLKLSALNKKARTRNASHSEFWPRWQSMVAAVIRGDRDCVLVTPSGVVCEVVQDEIKPLWLLPELGDKITRGEKKGQDATPQDVWSRLGSYLSQNYKGLYETALMEGTDEDSGKDYCFTVITAKEG